jgi:predicted DNA-binding transcriptional regulator YafY
MESSGRLLALLGLLQARTTWTGQELAARLQVSPRTVRNDIDRLRRLDYPVDAVRGRDGHYRLGVGAKLPPLLLDDDEAVAITVGLVAATGITGIEETSARALAKLEAILPHRLRRQVDAVRGAVSAGPENTGSNVPDPEIEVGLLTAIAAAIRDREEIRFDYGEERVQVQPYRLVSWQRRWYLVGRTARTDTWATYRLDWMALRTPGGPRFTPVELPGGDYTAFVLRDVAFHGWNVHARIAIDAPANEVLSRINPAVGVVEAVDESSCVLVTGADSVEIIAVYIGMLGLDFHVDEPPELVAQLRLVGERYRQAVS